jgi:signal transduction histidine kinase
MEEDSILLLLFDDKKSALVPAAYTGMPSGFIEQYDPIPIELYESSVDPLNPIFLTDTSDTTDLPNSQLFEKYDVRSISAVSLIREQQLIGMLGIYCFHEYREFTPDELALLKGLADQATQAIDNARLRIQAEQAAVTEERNRLARDLHDSITQSLYSQMLYSEAASRRLTSGDVQEVSEHLSVLRQTAHQALQDMRLLIYELRPQVLDEEGLIAAINARLEAVEGRSGQHTELNADGDLHLSPKVEATLYRIVQEALNNVLKHANAQKIIVSLTQIDGLVTLEVIDDGSGFDVASSQSLGSFGLQGMRERVSQMGGTIEVYSKPSEGTRVKVEVRI